MIVRGYVKAQLANVAQSGTARDWKVLCFRWTPVIPFPLDIPVQIRALAYLNLGSCGKSYAFSHMEKFIFPMNPGVGVMGSRNSLFLNFVLISGCVYTVSC